jgi:hypothetical protein
MEQSVEMARPRVAATSPAGPGHSILLLRAEGLVVLLLATWLYSLHGAGWLVFVVLFFVPDISMLGYLRDPRLGAMVYNLAHTYVVPLLLTGAGIWLARPVLLAGGLIWVAHIGLDRMLGYGLKLPTAFQDTHLGRIGKDPAKV